MNIARWLERLSLDAVGVAVLWGIALGIAVGQPLSPGGIGILAMATWLTYVADRLRDVRSGLKVPLTDRHLYYLGHYTDFKAVWLAGFIVVVPAAWLMLPEWQFLGGWGLVGLILLYLWLLGMVRESGPRLLLKRTAVPVVFTVGVGWMTECWRTPEGLVAAIVLLAGAFANVLLISCGEADESGPRWLRPAGFASVVLLGLAGLSAFAVYWPAGAAGIYGLAAYGILYARLRRGGVEGIRLWTDAALADMAIFIIVLEWLFR